MGVQHWLRLALTTGIGPVTAHRLVQLAGSAEAAVKASAALIAQVEGVGTTRASTLHQAIRAAAQDTEEELRRIEKTPGVSLICPDDTAYPLLLSTINDPPIVLYVKGAIEARDLESIAIVGSRRCSHYGREQAERFGALCAGAGLTVLSGGARGVDSAAHRGALQHPSGRTIAVLGCGVDVVFPPENKGLFDQIAQRGAMISEFPLGTPPLATNFPKRNRIVSGMSRGVLVVESDIRSGALITARLAGEDQGRPVMAIPGRLDNPMSAGPHQLLRDGATLVTCLDDLIEALLPLPDIARIAAPPMVAQPELEFTPPEPAPTAKAIEANPTESQILSALNGDSLSVDQLIDRTGLEASSILRELTKMTLRGLVKRIDGQTYARKR